MLSPGQVVTLTYPDSTLIESVAVLRDRHVRVIKIRDLVAHPLTPAEYLRRPLIRRSRYLITAWDHTTQSVRQFYLGSSREFASEGLLRVALYRPGDRLPYDVIGRAFGPTRLERRLLRRCLLEMRGRSARLRLRVIADDLGLVG